MKQSSIEWLFEQLTEVDYGCINKTFLANNKSLSGYRLRDLFDKAKEMHKKESENDYVAGGNYARCCSTLPKDIKESHKQYYNETYNDKS